MNKRFFEIFVLLTTTLYKTKCEIVENPNWPLNTIAKVFKMGCIQVQLKNIDNYVANFIYNSQIPIQISNTVDIINLVNSVCPNLMVQLNSTENLHYALKNYSGRKGFLFIVFPPKTNWEDNVNNISFIAEQYWLTLGIYKVFYVKHTKIEFYHPFLLRNGKYGTMVDTREYNIIDIFYNLNGYPLRIYIFDSVFSNVTANPDTLTVSRVDGVDAKVAYLLEKILNFTMELQWPDDDFFGARLENGSYNGGIGRMIRRETDITLSGYFIKDYLTRDVDFSMPVYMDKLCCYVMKAKRIPQSILPLYVVHENVWAVYMIFGLLSSFVWMLLRRFNLWLRASYADEEETIRMKLSLVTRSQYMHIFIDTWVLWVRMMIVRFPPFNAERIFAISLCLVSVIIGALLESSLATVYIRPRYYKDINTLQELDSTNLKIFYKHAAMRDDLFKDHSSKVYDSLGRRLMLVGEAEERLIYAMSKRGGFVAITRALSLELVDTYYLITKKVHMIPECPKTYHIAYLFTKHSPYEETVNVALLKFLAAGLIDQWINEKKHEAKSRIHNFKDYVAETSHQWKVFHINDLQLAFYVLATGNILALLLFIGEYIVFCKLYDRIHIFK